VTTSTVNGSYPHMRVEDFDYDLPDELIAQRPAADRDGSRLMVLRRADASVEHRHFRDLPDYLAPSDALVVNNTRVMQARLHGRRDGTGGRVEVFLLRPRAGGEWEALLRPGRRMKSGVRVDVGDGALSVEVVERLQEGVFLVRLSATGEIDGAIRSVGEMPLPPYITREADAEDLDRYQCVYAAREGAVAAPTAGLHFTPELVARVAALGVRQAEVTLHVGLGTFRPLSDGPLDAVRLHAEWAECSAAAAGRINEARDKGGRVVAVGTTSVRTLESAADASGRASAFSADTDVFIRPGYQFRAVDALVTNFHLPKSSLLMLVAAFAGYDFMRAAYEIAVKNHYRFYSYGDAMLIL
jgi:S-adenosylmethionine:tRNA ribosyltransferase-isomerase